MAKKKCIRCMSEKDISEFNNQKASRDGKMIYCRLCQKVDKAYRRYNVSEDVYFELMNTPNCQICGIELTSSLKPLNSKRVIDHSHDSGKIRGVLCAHCNSGIGLLKEDIDILISAIEYLKK